MVYYALSARAKRLQWKMALTPELYLVAISSPTYPKSLGWQIFPSFYQSLSGGNVLTQLLPNSYG